MIKLAQALPEEIGTWSEPTPTFSDIPSLLMIIMGWLLGLVGGLAVIAIIYSGFMYLTSAGDTNQAETAKKNLTWAIIGLALVAVSGIIVRVVNDIITTATPH